MNTYLSLKIKLELLLLLCVILGCVGVRLTPLENNDKLQNITNPYVAEWQWESWPIKQEVPEREGSLGGRKNVALWGDSSRSAWYLFGGQPISGDPKKQYSDIWKFKLKTRAWKKFFPFQGEVKTVFKNKKGGTTIVRQSNTSYFEPKTQDVVLCGELSQENKTKIKNSEKWGSLGGKRTEEEKTEELLSLAVYSSKASRSNTVWQIDAKEKLWTTYICYCEISKDKQENSPSNSMNGVTYKNKIYNETLDKRLNMDKNLTEAKISNTEDEVDNEQQHLSINNLKMKKKKINQIKKPKNKKIKKAFCLNAEITKERKERNVNLPVSLFVKTLSNVSEQKAIENANNVKLAKIKKEELDENFKNELEYSEGKLQKKTKKTEKMIKHKVASEYCPEFGEDGIPVVWCDGRNGAIVTADVSAPEITVWVFNLTTNHWSKLQIELNDGVEWPACENMSSIRHVGSEEEVYMFCSLPEEQLNISNLTSHYSVNTSKIPSENNFNTKLVFKINYTDRVLRSLGKIRLNPYFNSPEGENLWQNDTQSILRVVRNAENETILMLVYFGTIDLWMLNKNAKGEEGFDLVEKIWRGSALKRFDNYNAALYSLQFVSESGSSETILFPNPRSVGMSEYWPRERGRFIVRIFRNENLKKESFKNRTREQNLTYELLLYDYKPSETEHQLIHMYSLKVLVFFGISLAIFAIFGIVIFIKKCVTFPPVIRIRNEYHKSPLVIRYSIITDDLLYPVG